MYGAGSSEPPKWMHLQFILSPVTLWTKRQTPGLPYRNCLALSLMRTDHPCQALSGASGVIFQFPCILYRELSVRIPDLYPHPCAMGETCRELFSSSGTRGLSWHLLARRGGGKFNGLHKTFLITPFKSAWADTAGAVALESWGLPVQVGVAPHSDTVTEFGQKPIRVSV